MLKKYHKVFKEESDQWFEDHQSQIKESLQDPYRLKYHLTPLVGWLNDPNGLFEKDGVNHIYFQYSPYNIDGELKTWAHVTTKDFINFKEHEIFLYPDNDLDEHGAYSGSAFVEDDTIHYFYTGNIKLFDKEDYDYINSGRLSNTIHLTSKDGFEYSHKDCVLNNQDYPKNLSNHIRDPKIFKHEGRYYMVLGARDIDSKGCVVLYVSEDLNKWEYFTQITTKEPFGYMWECPDMFELDGKWFLSCCPQGVAQDGYKYENVHQSVIMHLDVDFNNKVFNVTHIQQLDYGFDFYAQQTYLDESNRRVMIGWMGIPDADYTNKTASKGWQHALTLPRELVYQNGNICQKPLQEMEQLRAKEIEVNNQAVLPNAYELFIDTPNVSSLKLQLTKGCYLSYENQCLTLDIETIGSGRTQRHIEIEKLENLHIFMDTSSLELFANNGEYVSSSRLYGDSAQCEFKIEADVTISTKCYQLNNIEVERSHLK